jgi:hypothetical protein
LEIRSVIAPDFSGQPRQATKARREQQSSTLDNPKASSKCAAFIAKQKNKQIHTLNGFSLLTVLTATDSNGPAKSKPLTSKAALLKNLFFYARPAEVLIG